MDTCKFNDVIQYRIKSSSFQVENYIRRWEFKQAAAFIGTLAFGLSDRNFKQAILSCFKHTISHFPVPDSGTFFIFSRVVKSCQITITYLQTIQRRTSTIFVEVIPWITKTISIPEMQRGEF